MFTGSCRLVGCSAKVWHSKRYMDDKRVRNEFLSRGSHYPHHTYFAEECDRQGILFWSENCFWGTEARRRRDTGQQVLIQFVKKTRENLKKVV